MSRSPRIDQTLSRLGYASRREAPLWAQQGRLTTRDGLPLKNCAARHDPADVLLDGEPLEAPEAQPEKSYPSVAEVLSLTGQEDPEE